MKPQRPDLVARAVTPDYALGAHTASLGLVFYRDSLLPQHYSGGAFIGQHGSWNRRPRCGYKVIFVAFADGHPVGTPEDVLTGFVDAQGNAQGRPAGVAVDRAGALLVADYVDNVVWRVQPDARKQGGTPRAFATAQSASTTADGLQRESPVGPPTSALRASRPGECDELGRSDEGKCQGRIAGLRLSGPKCRAQRTLVLLGPV